VRSATELQANDLSKACETNRALDRLRCRRPWPPAGRRAGLPEGLRAHDFRHTAASLLIRQGASVKAVQRSLGHKSAVMTLDRYGHLWPDELEDLAERLDRARTAAVAHLRALSAALPWSRYVKEQVNDLLP
jgi:integrase